jgi:photosystem II stability/assembly factor-like uncharacterized protein
MHLDGRTWAIVPTPNFDPQENYIYGIAALSSNNVWAVGRSRQTNYAPFIINWNGQQWTKSVLPALSDTDNILYAISAQASNDIWVVGQVGTNALHAQRALILHYNGVDWQAKPQGAGGEAYALFGVDARTSNDAWAVGYTYTTFDFTQPLAMRWNGTKWEPTETTQGLNRRNHRLYAVAVVGPNDVWAVGEAGVVYGPKAPFIQHWRGDYWEPVGAPVISEEGAILTAITASAPNDIWAVGYFLASGSRRVLLLHYDGNAWTHYQASGDVGENAMLYGVAATSHSDLTAVGYAAEGGVERSLVERYTDPCAQPTIAPTGTPTPTPALPVATVPIPGSNTRQFPETGKTVSGLFLDYWDRNGGLAQQGYPISGVIGEISPLNNKPYTVQYFERAVFEYHPENQAPYNVLLSQLGTFRYKQKYPNGATNQKLNSSPGTVLFPETGKHLGGRFLEYWQKNGGLVQQGYPISEEFQEKSDLNGQTYLVQYFERAVFELHSENKAPYDVLLSQLGTFRYKAKYGGK